MKRIQPVLLAIAAAGALAFSARPLSSEGKPKASSIAEVRRSIEAGNATWERAFHSLDAGSIASTFDEEGVNVGADGACVKGLAAIEAAMRSYFERSGPATTTRVEIGDIVVDGDLAYEWGRSEFHFAPKPGGPRERAGRYLAVWKRQPDGGWKLLRNIGLPDRSPAPESRS